MRNLILICACFLGIQTFVFGKVPEGLDPSQTISWKSMEAFVDNVTDGLGMPVDEGIKKAVVALNILKFETVQSCEGHLNWGLPYPWIALQPDQEKVKLLSELFRKKDTLCDECDILEDELTTTSMDQLEEMNIQAENKRKEIWKVWDEIDQVESKKFEEIWTLLQEFYGEDSPLNLTTLIIHQERLIPIGGLCQKRFSKEKQQENLIAFREEMDRFTEFLIEKFRKNNL